MRTIKFRAWDKERGKMLSEVHLEDDECLGEFSLCRLNKCLSETKLILMQYTGLKDKNGKEIYEGDIVYFERAGKDHDWKKPGWQNTIVWNEDCACFEEKESGNEIDREEMAKVEIIGNIYENPELLK